MRLGLDGYEGEPVTRSTAFQKAVGYAEDAEVAETTERITKFTDLARTWAAIAAVAPAA